MFLPNYIVGSGKVKMRVNCIELLKDQGIDVGGKLNCVSWNQISNKIKCYIMTKSCFSSDTVDIERFLVQKMHLFL